MFRDRSEAGRQLAEVLKERLTDADPVVLGLPRGGLPVAYEVARQLGAPLDVVMVGKLGLPFQPELAMGAIGEDGALVLNEAVMRAAGIDEDELAACERARRQELEERARRYRRGRPRVGLEGRTAIVVDDGIATGSTARAACQVARAHGAARVVLAVPVAPAASLVSLREVADEVIAVEVPATFFAVGQFYEDFSQVTDADVVDILRRSVPARTGPHDAADEPDSPLSGGHVDLQVGTARLGGHLTVPRPYVGLVIFAHGSGSSRHSPRNRYVAEQLNARGLATLLFDLLSVDEEGDRSLVFDVELLADRLRSVTEWARTQPALTAHGIGYFGASTGAAAALWAASSPGSQVGAVVSRGGRPDLAGARLAQVRAPTLLIVGGHDDVVLDLNRRAQSLLRCENRLTVVPGATHLFEEPGALEQVSRLAGDWFVRHLSVATTTP